MNDDLYHFNPFHDKSGRFASKSGVISKEKNLKIAYKIGANLNPRELKYSVKKMTNRTSDLTKDIKKLVDNDTLNNGILTSNSKFLKAVESEGIKKHSEAKYINLTELDIKNLKTYTDSARYSRNINSYLATGQPDRYRQESEVLKNTICKNSIDKQIVYRSCNFKFTTNGLARKTSDMSEADIIKMTDTLSKNFSGKSLTENRIFSTSTSPLFAIDTWRKVNPTASKTYNTYMVMNCKNTPGIYADGTCNSKKLVNTRSNQECILAPNKLTYRSIKWDEERKMFAILVDAT